MSCAKGLSLILLTALATAATGCTTVLGLDPPTLDPCLQGGCSDASMDATTEASDATTVPDAPGDAADAQDAHDALPEATPSCVWDGAVPDGSTAGIRCGGGCAPVVYCTGTSVCCQTIDAGVPVFACTTSESACPGYAIDCVNENDCTGNGVCCHYLSHMVCGTSCTSNADIACVPGSPEDCPAGKACDRPVVDGDAAVPYYTCEP